MRSHALWRAAFVAALGATSLGCGSSGSASGSGTAAAVSTAPTQAAGAPVTGQKPGVQMVAQKPGAPTAAAPAAAGGGPEADIPYAKGYAIAVPGGWNLKQEGVKGDLTLTPASGSGKLVISSTASWSALALRETQFLSANTTAGVNWGPEAEQSFGALLGKVARGEGVQFKPGGIKEIHKVLRVQIRTDVKDLNIDVNGKALVVIQALAVWLPGDAGFEKAALDALQGVHKK